MGQLLEQVARVISGPAPQGPGVDVDNVGSEATARRRELREAVQRITNAAKQERAALHEYVKALQACNDHTDRKVEALEHLPGNRTHCVRPYTNT
jgi:hypothetical protein